MAAHANDVNNSIYHQICEQYASGFKLILEDCVELTISNEQLITMLMERWAKKVLLSNHYDLNKWKNIIFHSYASIRDAREAGLKHLRARATIMEQKFGAGEHYEADLIRFNLGGRIMEFYNPSSCYIYDRGTEDQQELDLGHAFNDPNVGIFGFFIGKKEEKITNAINQSGRAVKGTKEGQERLKRKLSSRLGSLDIDASDAVLKPDVATSSSTKSKDAQIGYGIIQKKIIEHMRANQLNDAQVARMAKLILLGWESLNGFAASVAKDYMDEEGLDKLTAIRKTQPNYHPDLGKMPKELPLLLASWFVAETSRNPLSFYVSLMLLDLIEVGAKLPDGSLITWANVIFHPGYLDDALPAERKKELIRIGGLHPMSHKDSYTEFKGNKYQKGPPLGLVNIKSSLIVMSWMKAFPNNISSDNITFLSKESLDAIEKRILITDQEVFSRNWAFNCIGKNALENDLTEEQYCVLLGEINDYLRFLRTPSEEPTILSKESSLNEKTREHSEENEYSDYSNDEDYTELDFESLDEVQGNQIASAIPSSPSEPRLSEITGNPFSRFHHQSNPDQSQNSEDSPSLRN